VVPSTTQPRSGADTAFADASAIDPALVWVGSVDNPSGFSDEMRGFLRTLEAAGHEPALRDFQMIEKRAGLSQRDRALFERQKGRTTGGPTVAVHHYPAARKQFTIDGAVNVHRTMFETDSVPEDRLGLLLDRDQIWVPGEFNVETFVRGGVPREKLRVVGGTMEFDAYDPAATEPRKLPVPDDHFVFLTNFAFAERKAWKQLIRAWAAAFGPDDGVCLVLKTQSETRSDDYVRERIDAFLADEYGGAARSALAPIVVMTDILPTAQLPSIYAAADAYVLASRGEAWGRPYMESLAMGLPTIASRWSGNLEFMHDGNSFLVDGKLVSCEADAPEVFGDPCRGHSWFDPDVDALADAMRTVAGDPAAARERAAGARDELVARFGPEPTARRLGDLAREAWELHGDRRTKPLHSAVRGSHGASASLAVVNDGVVDGLLARGHNVRRESQHADTPLTSDAPGITHSWPPNFDPVTNGPTVAILPWEFGSPPRDWVDQVRARVDRVWVPSAFVRDGYVDAGMPAGAVEVVPNGVDLTAFTPDGSTYELPRTAGTTFLFVGGTTWRKGADILLTAWAQAFGPGDDVQLVIKDFGTATHYRNQTAGRQIRSLVARDDVAPVVYIEDELPFAELPALYRAADVLVVPYRGEGFCLPALEAMACGVPVVHNGEGPTREFVGATAGWPVPSTRVPLDADIDMPDLAGPGYVHEIDPAVLAEQLRAVAADSAGRRERAAAALEQARAHGWDAVAEVAERSLATLRAEALPLARDLRRTQIESREHTVLYAPDWNDTATWSATLATWAAGVAPEAPVTLALHVPDADAEQLGGAIVAALEAAGHPADTLPDLALCPYSETTAMALAASADAVLADPGADRSACPDLFRRARHVIEATFDEVRSYAEELRA
jgi:glycosyltransferase involved in cell wall biosynthesis